MDLEQFVFNHGVLTLSKWGIKVSFLHVKVLILTAQVKELAPFQL